MGVGSKICISIPNRGGGVSGRTDGQTVDIDTVRVSTSVTAVRLSGDACNTATHTQRVPVETKRTEFPFDTLQFQHVFNMWVLKSHLIQDGVNN